MAATVRIMRTDHSALAALYSARFTQYFLTREQLNSESTVVQPLASGAHVFEQVPRHVAVRGEVLIDRVACDEIGAPR